MNKSVEFRRCTLVDELNRRIQFRFCRIQHGCHPIAESDSDRFRIDYAIASSLSHLKV